VSFKPRFKYRESVTVNDRSRQKVPGCRCSAADRSFADGGPSEGAHGAVVRAASDYQLKSASNFVAMVTRVNRG